MTDKKSEVDAWLPATCEILAGTQLSPIDLSMPDSGLSMPDVQLEALCDIIFSNLEATKVKK